MGRERPLDLVVGVFALLVGVAMMADRRAGTGRGIFLLGADPGEINGLTRTVDRHDLTEPSLSPFGRVVAFNLEILCHHRGAKGETSNDGTSNRFPNSQHHTPPTS